MIAITKDKKFLVILGALLLLGYLPFINTQYFSFDDYFLFFSSVEGEQTVNFSIQSGRWFGIFLYSLFNQLIGVGGYKGILISYVSVLLQFLFVGLVIVKVFKLDSRKTAVPVIISMGFLHLFNAEIMTFKFGLLVNAGFSFLYLFAFGGWYFLSRKISHFIVGILLIVCALGSYQLVLNQLIVLSVLLFVFELLHQIEENKSISFQWIKKSDGVLKLIGVMMAAIAYYVVNKLVLSFLGIEPSTRSSFIQFTDISERISQIGLLYQSIFIKENEYLIPYLTKLLTLLLIALSIGVMVFKVIKNVSNQLKAISIVIMFLILSVLMILSSNFTSLFIKEWWPTNRMLTGFGFMVMGFTLIACFFCKNKYWQYFLLSISFVVLFSHLNVTHNIASDQSYRNYIDRNKAQMIMTQVVGIDSFEQKKVYIHQSENCWIDDANIKNRLGDLNISSFCTSWSKYQLLEYVSGVKLLKPNEEEHLELSKMVNLFSEKYQRWPLKGSVTDYNGYIIIIP